MFLKDKVYLNGYSFINIDTKIENKKFLTFDCELLDYYKQK